jgi:hypothetical protein
MPFRVYRYVMNASIQANSGENPSFNYVFFYQRFREIEGVKIRIRVAPKLFTGFEEVLAIKVGDDSFLGRFLITHFVGPPNKSKKITPKEVERRRLSDSSKGGVNLVSMHHKYSAPETYGQL